MYKLGPLRVVCLKCVSFTNKLEDACFLCLESACQQPRVSKSFQLADKCPPRYHERSANRSTCTVMDSGIIRPRGWNDEQWPPLLHLACIITSVVGYNLVETWTPSSPGVLCLTWELGSLKRKWYIHTNIEPFTKKYLLPAFFKRYQCRRVLDGDNELFWYTKPRGSIRSLP